MRSCAPQFRMGARSGIRPALWPWSHTAERHPAFLLPQSLLTPQERHAPHHFQGVCSKALAGQLVVHGAWLHAPVVAFAREQSASRHFPRQHCRCPAATDVRQLAAAVDKQFRGLGMGSPFVSSGIGALDSLGFMSRSAKRRGQVWEGLHVSPRTAPSKGAKLCTYHY